MPVYQFYREQELKVSVDQIWDFISSPKNLKEITPAYMGFDITTKVTDESMYPGMIIGYTVKPLLGIKTAWVTEITHVNEKVYFVDEQRKGPYKMWHHEHKVIPTEDGVLMTDLITYEPPLGFIGSLMNFLFIKKKLNQIFEFRRIVLDEKFNQKVVRISKNLKSA